MKPIMKAKLFHVDDFIDDPCATDDGKVYARWVLNHFRLSSDLKNAFDPFMKDHKLFCTYKDERYRVVGASTMGDIWLVKNYNKDYGHDERVYVNDCSKWSSVP